MLGEQWKSLTDKEKTPYEAKAAADKKRYEEEKAAYTAVSVYPTPFTELVLTIFRAPKRRKKRSRGTALRLHRSRAISQNPS